MGALYRHVQRNVPLRMREDEIIAVLQLLQSGRNAFAGIDLAERGAEGRAAYVGRQAAVEACRDRKLIDASNRLTEAGRKALGEDAHG